MTRRQGSSKGAGAAGEPPRITWLARVPLRLRVIFYGLFFLLVVLVGLPFLAYQIDVARPEWQVELGWGRWFGWALLVGALVLYVYTAYFLTRHGRGAYVEFDPPKQFVATGPYLWMRNPIAGCVVLMLLGEAVALSSTGIAMLFVASIPLAHLQIVLLEEPLLARRFGKTFTDYTARVPRWIPRLRRRSTA